MLRAPFGALFLWNIRKYSHLRLKRGECILLIGFVRHGETEWNAKGITQGQTDIPLNEAGLNQAKALAGRLSREAKLWDAVISSDLQRAHVTAQLLADGMNVPLLESDKRLRERYFGETEGTSEQERRARWGEQWRQIQSELGVESDASVRARGLEALREWQKHAPNRNLLIVSHGSFIAQMLIELCVQLEDQRLSNLSYSILELRSGNWHPLLHNCTRHLEE